MYILRKTLGTDEAAHDSPHHRMQARQDAAGRSTIQFRKQVTTPMAVVVPKAKSSLVRRLVAAQNDPAKRRIRIWLADLDDLKLSQLGLTSDDIAILRDGAIPRPSRH
jgi:hypothetical protein